ncbi:MAG: hypothetical protein AAF195_02000 [Pseudomonadota bacterium]
MKPKFLLAALLSLFPNVYPGFKHPTNLIHPNSPDGGDGGYLSKLAGASSASAGASSASAVSPRVVAPEEVTSFGLEQDPLSAHNSIIVSVIRLDPYGYSEPPQKILETYGETSFKELMDYLGINYPASFYKDPAAKLKLPDNEIFGESGILIISAPPYSVISKQLFSLSKDPRYQNMFKITSTNSTIECTIKYNKYNMEIIENLMLAIELQNQQKSIYR